MPPDGQARPGGVACREASCLHHDGRGCRFPWIEPPGPGEQDRGICRNFILVEGDEYVARVNAIF